MNIVIYDIVIYAALNAFLHMSNLGNLHNISSHFHFFSNGPQSRSSSLSVVTIGPIENHENHTAPARHLFDAVNINMSNHVRIHPTI